MEDNNLEIRGRKFRTKSDYAAGWRDNRKIEQLEENFNRLSIEDVKRIISDIESRRIIFETLVGDDYLDELYELEDELKKSSATQSSSDGRSNGSGRNKKSAKSDSKNSGKVVKSLEDYDPLMREQIIREMKKSQIKRTLTLIVLGICVVGSVGYLIFYFALYQKNGMEYDKLASLKDDSAGGTVEINYSEDLDAPPILKKYETLYQKNKKLVGWIKIDGCDIDYPVMQTSNNEYYLDHNYNQEYDKNGSIFMDMNCTPAFPNDNMILYGHHMKSGKMFGNLNRYAKEDFYLKNKTFTFDTIYETGTYQVMYVFRSHIFSEEEIVFKYYQFIDASGEDEFYSNMEEMEKMSLYDTGVVAYYGDKLITLSTCDSSEEDGRFVVVAKKVD